MWLKTINRKLSIILTHELGIKSVMRCSVMNTDKPKRGRGQPKKLDPKIPRKMRLAPDVDAIIRAQAANGTGAMTRFVEDAIREKFNRESEK